MFSAEQITGLLCSALGESLTRLVQASPMAGAFASAAGNVGSQALLRHAIEHVHRIRMFRPLDATATRLLSATDGEAAALWGRYARSEAVHDRYFIRDLEATGISREVIEATSAFASTARLGTFVSEGMQDFGALPVVLYSFWAEQNSETGSPIFQRQFEAAFGSGAVRGAAAHRALDARQDHGQLVAQVLAALVRDADDAVAAVGILDAITTLLGDYFDELSDWREHATQTPAGHRASPTGSVSTGTTSPPSGHVGGQRNLLAGILLALHDT